mgnify:CR=1 FL=1
MTGLVLKNVTKSFKEGSTTVDALKNVSLTVAPGDFIAIIGPSGSGKSTLLSIAGALLQPSKGEVLVNGTDIGKMKEKDLSSFRLTDVGFILQTSNLIPYLTVLDQLLLVRKMKGKVTSKEIDFAKKLLTELGLGDKLNKFPNEPDEVIEALDWISFADEDEIKECLETLANNEHFEVEDNKETINDGNLRSVVHELIEKEKMTYEEFAKKIGFQEKDILLLIRKGTVSMGLLNAICKFFGIEKTDNFLRYVRDSGGKIE